MIFVLMFLHLPGRLPSILLLADVAALWCGPPACAIPRLQAGRPHHNVSNRKLERVQLFVKDLDVMPAERLDRFFDGLAAYDEHGVLVVLADGRVEELDI